MGISASLGPYSSPVRSSPPADRNLSPDSFLTSFLLLFTSVCKTQPLPHCHPLLHATSISPAMVSFSPQACCRLIAARPQSAGGSLGATLLRPRAHTLWEHLQNPPQLLPCCGSACWPALLCPVGSPHSFLGPGEPHQYQKVTGSCLNDHTRHHPEQAMLIYYVGFTLFLSSLLPSPACELQVPSPSICKRAGTEWEQTR